MSLLTIVQQACQRIGIDTPSVVIGSAELRVIQMLALLNKEGKELSTGASVGLSYDWQELQTEASFVTVATESQGALATIAPGIKYIIGNTIWDRSTRMPAYGSMTAEEWQNYKAWGVLSPFPKYRIRGGLLLLLSVPAAGESYYFEYQSKNWCTDSTGAVSKSAFSADADISKLDEDMLTDGLVWRWKQAKGLDYGEDFSTYQRDVTNAIVRNTERQTLNMGRVEMQGAGVVVPIGSWPI
jgi:hypothetical protein